MCPYYNTDQLAAELLMALVDTACLGRLGPEVLGEAGVAILAQYAVSKHYNDPKVKTAAAEAVCIVRTAERHRQRGIMLMRRIKKISRSSPSPFPVHCCWQLVGLVQQMVAYTVFFRAITSGMVLSPASAESHITTLYFLSKVSRCSSEIHINVVAAVVSVVGVPVGHIFVAPQVIDADHGALGAAQLVQQQQVASDTQADSAV